MRTSFTIALTIALVSTGVLVSVLRRSHFWDVPNDRSSHLVPTLRGGGMSVLFAIALAMISVVENPAPASVFVLIGAAVALSIVGLVDDVRSLSSRLRLNAQVVVAVVIVTWAWVGVADGPEPWAPVFVSVALVGFVAYVNAFNFMDGINGISAFNTVVAGGWYVWLGREYELETLVVLGAALAGAAVGFLPWNLAGRIFLGDVGSYGLGALLAGCAVLSWSAGAPGMFALAPLLVYFADTGWVILKRARAREKLTEAHRQHVYQRLVDGGSTHIVSALFNAGVAVLCCLTIAWGYERAPVPSLLAVGLVLLGYLNMPRVVPHRLAVP